MTIPYENFLGRGIERSTSSTLQLSIRDRRVQVLTATTTGLEVRLPAVQKPNGDKILRKGTRILIVNAGANDFDLKRFEGGAMSEGTITLSTDDAIVAALVSDDTAKGTWTTIPKTRSAVTPDPVRYGYVFGASGASNDQTWEHNPGLFPKGWTQKASSPFTVDIDEVTVGNRQGIGAYVHRAQLFSEEMYSYDPNVWASSLDTTGTRSGSPFHSAAHDRDTGDHIWFFGFFGSGSGTSDDNEVAQYIVGSDNFVLKPNMAQSIDGDGWSGEDAAGENAFMFTSGTFPQSKTFRYTFSGGPDATELDPCPRPAPIRFGGFHLSDRDEFIDLGGRIAASPLSNSRKVYSLLAAAGSVWIEKDSYSGTPVHWFAAWGIKDTGYVYGGVNELGASIDSLFSYAPLSDFWVAQESSGIVGGTTSNAGLGQGLFP